MVINSELAPHALPDSTRSDAAPAWAPPLLLLALLNLSFDLVALIPLGDWMTDHGILTVSAIYFLHVLSGTALACWTVAQVRLIPD
ncbi:hypothetical protein [Nocardia camponoti]|uniref:Uncharacterized protein n=1 Tax=Nocardia camponoti TaxID=1616106 RepID=A0A917QPN8_9NOCA|nr:hypothetical protein [Nocardia camponoti]GGK62096.1 hypothetical protein GCM10011591_37950 [Nocardia camponoti]